jgi:hypothetical protein
MELSADAVAITLFDLDHLTLKIGLLKYPEIVAQHDHLDWVSRFIKQK